MFELASIALRSQHGEEDTACIRDTAATNGIDTEQLTRATEVIRQLAAAGEDVDAWIRREYIIDGWLHGYLPLDLSLADPAVTTWKLGQYAEAYYAPRPASCVR